MKKQFVLSQVVLLSAVLAQSCANNHAQSAPVSTHAASAATPSSVSQYSVNSADRANDLNQLEGLKQKLETLQNEVLAPANEDKKAYPAYAEDAKDRGLVRLMASSGTLPTIGGGGSYYSFARLDHAYGYGSDIALDGNQLSVGFAGADYGFFANLGDVSLDQISSDSPDVSYAVNYAAPNGQKRAAADAEFSKFRDGVSEGGFTYKSSVEVQVGATYVLHSISYDTSDVVVAFQIVREDSDGSMILIWKLLKSNPAPTISQ